ncbi:MAG: DUF2948 family protein [Alphaproteobacteria bacterium]|nr:DUF2948 family protein [Alphaproteobacteria bacterium]
MNSREPLLAAEDAEDLEILSARLQDAVGRIKDFVYLPKKRRFAAVLNRFKWERDGNGRGGADARVRSGLFFDGVLSARSRNLKRGAPDAVVSLLAISFSAKSADDSAGTIELQFSGGGAIRLEVECIEAGLQDISGEWAARGRPAHEQS